MKDLEPQKQSWIEQVAATMAIEAMPLDNRTYEISGRSRPERRQWSRQSLRLRRSTTMDNIYCYPGSSSILINKLNIHEKDRLLTAEIRLTAIRLYQLQESPIHGDFGFNHLCRIHQHMFQDIYSWAGEIRKVNIAKGNMFCLVQHIRTYAQTVFLAYYEDCMRVKDDPERFIHVFTRYYADLNALHPFREGNGRSQREFARELCLRCGYLLDLTHTDHEEMLTGSIMSFDQGDNTGLETVFRKCIIPLSVSL